MHRSSSIADAGRGRAAADLSVLMPVHRGVDPEHLRLALTSVSEQTIAVREIVVVVDGPVSAEHDRVLAEFGEATVLRLPVNVGSGLARRAGAEICTGTWIGLADSDDISEPWRFERQLSVLEELGADVCSAAMLEFSAGPDHVLGLRPTPVDHDAFARAMGLRNPVNQPATVFRREAGVRAGGYQHLPYLEDYDLWARMIATGARFTGTPEPLVRFRSDGMLARRTSPEALAAERELSRRLRSYGLVGPIRATTVRVIRGAYLRLPQPALELAYRMLFRRTRPAQRELADTQPSSVARAAPESIASAARAMPASSASSTGSPGAS